MIYQSALGVLLVCGVAFAAPGRIVEGDDTDITEIPYQVSIQLVGNNHHFCGGAIIHKRWILTAGHCTDSQLVPSRVQVVVGMTKRSLGGVVHTVQRIIREPRYGSLHTYSHDIALIELHKPIQYNARAQPVSLPRDSDKLPVGMACKVGGWGRLSDGGPAPNHLQSITIPIWEPGKCARAYSFPDDFFVGPSAPMICANWEGSIPNTCNGDSGGPLVCNGVQFGIVSFGKGCTNPDYPKVFANVQNLKDFITTTTGIDF